MTQTRSYCFPVRKHVLLYGILAGLLIAVLKTIEYRWLIVEHSVEMYGALVAAVFAAIGIGIGGRLTRGSPRSGEREREVLVREVLVAVPVDVVREIHVSAPAVFQLDSAKRDALGITPRELEVLALMAEGFSNKEIAERAFVSENTVKTHASRVFDKLGARRRTQAVQLGKSLRLIP